MKPTGICPKCNSKKIVVYKANSMQQGSTGATNFFGMVTAKLDRYFCVNCGFSEEYAQINKSFAKWADKELKKQKGSNNFGDDFV